MGKMASLHADLHTIPDDALEYCEICGDEVMICDMLEECPGRYRRAAERLK